MRCRKLSHHYTVFVTKNQPRLREKEKAKAVVAYSHWTPPTDIYETDSTIYITAELAGVSPVEIDVALYENALVVEGHRKLFLEAQEKGVYLTAEIPQGPFCLEVLLPNSIDLNKVDARYEEGLLTIVLFKKKGK